VGEYANDTINGLSCSWCGVYFEESHGYPVVCDSCREETDDYNSESDPQPAKHDEL